MPRRYFAFGSLALAALPLAAQQPDQSAQPPPTQRDPFPAWDRNADGQLSRDELPERLRPNFERVDRDHDGFISRQEHQAATAPRSQAPNQPAGQPRPSLPANIDLRQDLNYAGDQNPRHTLDLLLPKDRKPDAKLPLVVFIHGGAWQNGNKAGGIQQLAPLVASGRFAGATIAYRLTDEAQWPAQIHDCKAAIRFLRAKAPEFGLDPDKIAAWGSSAGGHLVSLLGTSGGAKELEGDLGDHDSQSSRVACVVNYFGPQNFLTMVQQKSVIDRHRGGNYPEAKLLGGPVPERADLARQASPVTWVSPDDPPFLTAHGTDDQIVPFQQAEEIHAALTKAGVPSHLARLTGAGHGFRSPELDRRLHAFLDHHLLGLPADLPADPIPPGR